MKKMLAIAVAAAFAAPAVSLADTTLYGILKTEIVNVKATAPGTSAKNSDMQDNGSRIGVKGSTPLNAGMAATYVVEYGTDMSDGGALTGRQSYVGLKSQYGEFRFGKQWGPTKLSSGKAEMFGDQLGDYNSRGGLSGNTEAAVNDAVAYVNKFGNVGVALLNTPDTSGAGSNGNNNSAWDGMINYSNNGLYAALGHQAIKNSNKTTRVTGAYTFPAGHKVGLVHQQVKPNTGNNKVKGTVISGGYKLGNGMIKAQFGQNKTNTGKAKLSAIGYDYKLGKKTKIFAEYVVGKDSGSGIDRGLTNDATAGGAASGEVLTGATKEKAFGMGIVHSF